MWDAAAASPTPRNGLEAIAAGKFKPRTNLAHGTAPARQKQNAAGEASLLLGELFQQSGDPASARTWYSKAIGGSKSGGWVAKMATARLKALGTPVAGNNPPHK